MRVFVVFLSPSREMPGLITSVKPQPLLYSFFPGHPAIYNHDTKSVKCSTEKNIEGQE
jgi:hypothetical protein